MRSKRQGLEKIKKFTHYTAYKEYKKKAGDNALTYRQYDAVICKFFYQLNREIIVDKYEWKVPFSGGYIRIGKNKAGIFYWKWDRDNPYTRIKKKKMWSFKPVEDWKTSKIGARGLVNHFLELRDNPQVANYDVPNIRHFVPKGKKAVTDEITED